MKNVIICSGLVLCAFLSSCGQSQNGDKNANDTMVLKQDGAATTTTTNTTTTNTSSSSSSSSVPAADTSGSAGPMADTAGK